MSSKTFVLGLPFVVLAFTVGCEQKLGGASSHADGRTTTTAVAAAPQAAPATVAAPAASAAAPANSLSDGATSVTQVQMTADVLAVGDATCATGGQKITAFLSTAGHTTYQDGDILLKTYDVCNGAAGAAGSAGAAGAAGKDGANAVVLTTKLAVGSGACPAGGLSIESFTDVNGNGSFDAGDLNDQVNSFCSTFVDVLVNDGTAIAVAKKVDSQAASLAAAAASASAAAQALLAQDVAALNALTATYNADQTAGAPATATYNAAVASQSQAQSALDTANAKLASDQSSLSSFKTTIDVSVFDSKHTYSLTVDADVQALIALVKADLCKVADYSSDSAKGALAAQQALVQADMNALSQAQTDTANTSLTLSAALVEMRAQLTLWMNGQPNTYTAAQAAVQAAYDAMSTKNSALTAASNALNADSAKLNQMMKDKDTWTRDSAVLVALGNDLNLIRAIALDVSAVAVATSTLSTATAATATAKTAKDAADQLVASDSAKVTAQNGVVTSDTTSAASAADAKAQALAVQAKADDGIAAAQAKLAADIKALKAAFGDAVAAQLAQYQADVAAAVAAGLPLPTPSASLVAYVK